MGAPKEKKCLDCETVFPPGTNRKRCPSCVHLEITRRKNVWVAENPEKIAQAGRKWRAANSEKDAKRHKKYQVENAEKISISKKDYRAKNFEGYLLRCCRQTAKDSGLDFNLGLSDIAIPKYCPCCPPENRRKLTPELLGCGRKKRILSNPSVDRRNSEKGYIKGNVWIICVGCNMSKRDSSYAQREQINHRNRVDAEADPLVALAMGWDPNDLPWLRSGPSRETNVLLARLRRVA